MSISPQQRTGGGFFYPGGTKPGPDVICLGPPFTVTKEQVDYIVDVMGASLSAAVAGL
jgi:adenosylmethionine-8-amino-7-oxononanoate aminotransferase